MLKRTSLKDIAKKLGVSSALVSSVINGKDIRVSEEMAKKIRKTAEDLNYQPNEIARSLRKGLSNTLGLIVADISNPFFATIARHIENIAATYGYTLIIGSSDEEIQKSEQLISTFLKRQVDGLIIAPVEGTNLQISSLLQKKIPLVLIDRYFPGLNSNYVVLDNTLATYEATSFLINRGYKRIAIVAYKLSLIHMKDRIGGYVEAMTSNNLSENICVIEISPKQTETTLKSSCIDLFVKNKKVDAIIFSTNLLSIEGLYCVNENKLKIPKDLGIIGFDGGYCFDLFTPPITFIKQPIEDMAAAAIKILMESISNKESPRISHIILEPNMIVRESC